MKPKYDCDCDLVIEMQEAGIGVEEIAQYALRLTRSEVRSLIRLLEEIVEDASGEACDAQGHAIQEDGKDFEQEGIDHDGVREPVAAV